MSEQTLNSESAPRNALFEGANKYLTLTLVVFILAILGLSGYIFIVKKAPLIDKPVTQQPADQTRIIPEQQQNSIGNYHSQFVERIKKDTIPKSPDKITTIRYAPIEVTEVINNNDDFVIIGNVETAKLGKQPTRLGYPKSLNNKISVWDFKSGEKRQIDLTDVKAGNTAHVIEKINVAKAGYEDSIEAIMIELF